MDPYWPAHDGKRRLLRWWRVYLAPMVLFVALFAAAGMTGGNCAILLPSPEQKNSDSGNEGIYGSLANPRPAILDDDHILGDASASLTIVAYEDYQSRLCGTFARVEFPTIKEQYIDTGKVRWVFRHYPLADNERAGPAARAAECADDQGYFFEYRDLIYDTTDAVGDAILTDEQLDNHADTLELDKTDFDACTDDDNIKRSRVQQDVKSGAALGINDLPAFFIEDELISGFQTAEKLSKIIDRHLNDG